METKRIIHPADLQDREGFLRFLNRQASQGWEADTIGPTSTLFRKVDTPPRGYTMAYDRDKEWPIFSEEGYHIVPCSVNGFAVYPTDEVVLPDPTWPDQVLDGADQAPNILGGDRLRLIPLAVPVWVLLSLFGVDLSSWGQAGYDPVRIQGPMFWVLLVLSLLSLVIPGLMAWVDRRHQTGLRAAREGKTIYRPDETLAKLVPLKNRLVRVQTALAVVTLILWVIFSGITSGSIQL